MKLKWILMVPVMLAITVLTLPLAPILALLVHQRVGRLDNNTKTGEGYFLFDWLSWFQTPDNSIDGDQGWREEHWQWRYKLPAVLATYVGRIGWLWRNPGYGFGVVELANTGPEYVQIDDSLYIQIGNYFQHRTTKPLGSKQLYCNFGWNIKGLAEAPIGSIQLCTFAFSVRLINAG